MNTSSVPYVSPEMFPLSAIYQGWRGERIASLKRPIEQGLHKLRETLLNSQCTVFIITTNFSFGDTWETINSLEGFQTRDAAEQSTRERLDAETEQILSENPGWHILDVPILEPNVLPATGSIIPGRFPRQAAARKMGDGSPYSSAYVRAYLIERQDAESLSGQILNFDGFAELLIRFLANFSSEESC